MTSKYRYFHNKEAQAQGLDGMNKSSIDSANTEQQEKTNQQHALEVFGTDWHENTGLQPVLDDVVVDVVFYGGDDPYCNNTAKTWSWCINTTRSPCIKKWRVHYDEKELVHQAVSVNNETGSPLKIKVGADNISDGSTAKYYELPDGAKELQDLISFRDMNSQIGEIFRSCYRFGIASHSDRLS